MGKQYHLPQWRATLKINAIKTKRSYLIQKAPALRPAVLVKMEDVPVLGGIKGVLVLCCRVLLQILKEVFFFKKKKKKKLCGLFNFQCC
jgi:hypothetical protein